MPSKLEQIQEVKGKQSAIMPYSQDKLLKIQQDITDLPSSSTSLWLEDQQAGALLELGLGKTHKSLEKKKLKHTTQSSIT